MRAFLVFISGKVQGVGMRYFIRKNALAHNISGYAKNLLDSRVEALFIGQEQKINELLMLIKEESPGFVKDVVVKEVEVPEEWLGKFEIL